MSMVNSCSLARPDVWGGDDMYYITHEKTVKFYCLIHSAFLRPLTATPVRKRCTPACACMCTQ